MTELTYHDGHYHRAPPSHHRQREQHQHQQQPHRQHQEAPGGMLKTTHDAWDKVLYGIGSAYYKLRGL